ncbi:hypothetical protein ACFZAM_32005 [Streptomyces sp. NPDC008079]|uniref:hypothetical protein n=1 Tax=Streptomyces sp. NPDC008079 TaxID=3364806 RepID=UPI0036E72B49
MPIGRPDSHDRAVDREARALVNALRYRIAAHVYEPFPEARTVRTTFNEYSGRHTIWEVCGDHGKVLFRQESDGQIPPSSFGRNAEDDVDLLLRVLPAQGGRYVRSLSDAGMWSIHLPGSINPQAVVKGKR